MEDQKPDKAALDRYIQEAAISNQRVEGMEDKKPDKAALDRHIQQAAIANQRVEGTNASGIVVKKEPKETAMLESSVNIKTEPPDDIHNRVQKFPSYIDSRDAPSTSGFNPQHNIAGPSGNNMSSLDATQILQALGSNVAGLCATDDISSLDAQMLHALESNVAEPSASATQMLQALAERAGPSGTDDAQRKKSVFNIDTSLISGAPSAEQGNELDGLGVTFYNQEEFEAGVMQQVDQAITLEEERAAKQRTEKDLNAVLTDIRLCKQEISRLDRLINAVKLPAAQRVGMKDAHRKMLSIKTQRENKAKQLKTLRCKHKTLLAKLSGSSVGLEPSDDEETDQSEPSEGDANILKGLLQGGATMNTQETERERMIRLGEMTPFGTTMRFTDPISQRITGNLLAPTMTDFEKAMLAKDGLAVEKRKKLTMANKMARKRRLEREQEEKEKKKREEELAKKKKTKSEKLLKKGKSKSKKQKTSNDNSKQSTSKAASSENTFEDGTFFVYKPTRSESSEFPKQRGKKKGMGYSGDMRPNWGSDDEMSDCNNGDVLDDSDEYRPDEEEVQDYEEDGDYVPEEIVSPKRKGKGKKRKFSDDIEDGLITSLDDLKRAHGVRTKTQRAYNLVKKAKDDSSQDQFFKRLRENKKKRLREKQQRIERGEDGSSSEEEDMEFEGGLQIPGGIWKKLYRYQKTGVKWLWELHQQQAGGIVGDEMGLGKTFQMIAFLAGLKGSKLRSRGTRYVGLGPVLIVCPTTVMHQWVKEFHTWSPEFRVAILHDSGSHSGTRSALVKDIAISHSVIVTSYSSVRLRQDILLRHDWHYVILDEGHKIRNPDAHCTLACKQFRTPHRIILSGSPMQNNLRELWSLFDFVFPGKLGTLPVFMEKFSVPITIGGYSNASSVQVQTAYKCACVLRDTINPYLLRRMKSDVKHTLSLPEKSEQVLFCRLSDEQTDIYKEYLESKECQLILNKEFQVFAGLIKLRKICNHPDLVSGGPKLLISEAKDDENLPEDLHYGYWRRSGKMIVVESLLKLWKQQNHRVLLFSQSKQLLDIMESFVKDKYIYMRMDGGTPISSRQTLINKFNATPSIFLFMLTTRVGGLGVNLTGANRVVIFDPDWNPSTDLQARERAWRIGQTKQVTIYRLLTTGTIEEKIYHRQIFKTFLSNRVLKDPRQRRFFKSNDLFELFSLGSSANTHGTETSAIFAGTGSNVKVPKFTPKVTRQASLTKSLSLPRTKSMSGKLNSADKKASAMSRTKSTGNMSGKMNSAEKDAKRAKVRRSVTEPARLSDHNGHEIKSEQVDQSSMPKSNTSAIKTVEDRSRTQSMQESGAKINSQSIKIETDTEQTPEASTAKGSSISVTSPVVKASLAERARQLARQFANNKNQNDTTTDQATSIESTTDNAKTVKSTPEDSKVTESSLEKARTSEDTTLSKSSPIVETSPEKKASLAERAKQIAKQLVSKAKDGGSSHHLSHSPGKSPVRSKDQRSEGSSTRKKEESLVDKKRKKKKKKKHDASIEGHRIANLAKHTDYRPAGQGVDEDEGQTNAQLDDYVLHRLFKKSGVHSALQHDNIMNSSNPDYMLVEKEADHVAKEAVQALKASRQRCMTAASGVPTWTGSSGHSGAPPGIKKPRFGQKANKRVIGATAKQAPSTSSVSATKSTPPKSRFGGGEKKKHFQGDAEESLAKTSAATPALPDSNDLLAKMRARNHIALLNDDSDDDEDAPNGAVPTGSVEGDGLLRDIHQFVSFQGEVDGQASTAELLRQFSSRLPKNSSAVFKSMLTKICNFHRNNAGLGVWKLKPDFR